MRKANSLIGLLLVLLLAGCAAQRAFQDGQQLLDGGAVGGALGGVMTGITAGAATGGLVGLSSAALTAGIIEALKAGNDCPCGSK